MPPVAAPPDLVAAARAALERGRDRLLEGQDDAGWWLGELESNATIVAEHVFLVTMLGIARPDDLRRLANELRARQLPEGGWPVWHGGPPDLSTSVEAWYALCLCGVPAADPEMVLARDLIRRLGGANRTRFFTRLWLAVMGRYPWKALPVIPPELILLPVEAPFSPYRFACWARGTFVALMIVLSRYPTYPQPVGLDELFLEPPGTGPKVETKSPGRWTPWFDRATVLARIYNRFHVRFLRRRAEERVVEWLCEHQEADGSWGGIQPPWIYSIIALHAMGFPLDHPVVARALAGFDGTFRREDGERLRVEACQSPVWDTALSLVALGDCGVSPDHPAMSRGVEWLLGKEVTRLGDWWQIPRRGAPGGWSFEFENTWYPDTDDTSEVLLALRRAGLPNDHPAVRRGVEWMLAMQSSNGGWAAFDVDNDRRVMMQLPFCDFGEVIDPPTEDVTAHVIEALVHCGVPATHPAVRRGLDYLRREQRPDGSWWGRWGVNHIYGVGCVLPALAAAGEDMRAAYVRRAVDWLASRQNADGGWGERVESYLHPEWVGRGPSTASQTSWALIALLAADPNHPAVSGGVRFLVETQDEEGSWDEPEFTGTGFPGDFMINYHLYRQVFPVTALARFAT